MALTIQEQMLVEQRVTNESKSAGVAYILLVLVGCTGAHRFYLGRSGSGAAMLILFVLGWLTLALFVGFALLFAVVIWALIDLFLIPGMVEAHKRSMRYQMESHVALLSASNNQLPTQAVMIDRG